MKKLLVLVSLALALVSLGLMFGCTTTTETTTTTTTTTTSSSISTSTSSTTTTTAAATWQVVGTAGFSSDYLVNERIGLFVNDTPYVAYRNYTTDRITIQKYNGSNWVILGSENITVGSSTNHSIFPSLYVYSNVPYVALREDDAGWSNVASYVIKFNTVTSSWETLGQPFATSNLTGSICLKFDGSGVPWVGFYDNSVGKASVRKYNSSNQLWEVYYGSGGLPTTNSSLVSFDLDNNDKPYIAFEDQGLSNKLSVVSGESLSGWLFVGSRGISTATIDDLAFDIYNNTPYVAYQDNANSEKAAVMKFNGSAWENVGGTAATSGKASYISLQVYNGSPYMAYVDATGAAIVQKFNGTSWEQVGSSPSDSATQTSLFVYGGVPYLAFRDGNNSNKITVMKYQ